ncbi:GmrSD restriction endonuclease domain-containing protein [Fructilactobacillus sanfranciscensis]|uniref:GmrSD restriction endonuclease domain-containing protein n=1 Tax=Fructilactobacillus sanfranciscensis TaxID=1625 RepID=UPI0030BA2AB8
MDGQQRLNSLYIGIKGTYAEKLPRKHWTNSEDNFPPMKLYLEIKNIYTSDSEIDKQYNFKFLRKDQVKEFNKKSQFWFEVGKILTLSKSRDQLLYLQKIGLGDNEHSAILLKRLSSVLNKDTELTYYVEDEQNLDKVLDIFIRTNDGGTKLTFSDLLMSVLTANWPDAREKFNRLIQEVYSYGDFTISSDLILKTTLVLFSNDIKNRVKNFDNDTVNKIIKNWDSIRKSILSTFKMFYCMGFRNKTFPAKSAAIPIILYVYDNKMYNDIVKNKFFENKSAISTNQKIKKWLLLAFLKHVFSGQTDSVLKDIRHIIRKNGDQDFPIEKIIDSSKNNPTKNYSFDSEIVDGLFQTTYGNPDVFFILSLYYPELDYFNQDFHIDHIHPKDKFLDEKYMKSIFSEDTIQWINDNWNCLGNLELLNGEKNESKKDKPLKSWSEENKIPNSFFFVDDDISLRLEDFKEFYSNRVANMKQRLFDLLDNNTR